MALSSEELTLARTWIGITEPTDVFEERYDRLGSLDEAIEESLRSQLTHMVLDQPGQFTVPGISAQYNENMKQLSTMLEDFVAQGGTDATTDAGEPIGVHVTKLYRYNRR